MNKKASLGLIILLCLSIVISACGSNAGTNNAQGGEGKSGDSEPIIVEFSAGADPSGELNKAIDRFNASRDDIQIKFVELPQTPNEQFTRYSTWFNSNSKTPDVFLMDVIWPALFASAGWLAPIDEYVDDEYLQRFWPAAVEVGQFDGKQYAIQSWMDVGIMFYREDLLAKYNKEIPQTWEQLEAISKEIMEKEGNPNLVGYVYQGAKIEGATINWLEVLWGLGGDVVQADGTFKVDTPEGIKALETLRGFIDNGVSPESVSNATPNDNQIVFGNGNAIFMRNWPGFHASMKGTEADGKYAMTSVPHSEGQESHGSTGGWVYGINSKSEHKDAAWEVMKFLLSDEEQKNLGAYASKIPSVKKVFEDPEVIKAQPIFEQMPEFLATAKSRPAIRNYEQFSRIVQTEINLVIAGQKDAAAAMQDAQKEIDKEINK